MNEAETRAEHIDLALAAPHPSLTHNLTYTLLMT